MKKKPRWSDREIAAYHDALSEEEIVREIESADWKPVDFVVKRSKPRSTRITLPPEIMATVERIAKKRGVDHQTLLQQWIQGRVKKELPIRS